MDLLTCCIIRVGIKHLCKEKGNLLKLCASDYTSTTCTLGPAPLPPPQLKVAQHLMEMELCPLSYILNRTLDLLIARDTDELFHQAVDSDQVRDRK